MAKDPNSIQNVVYVCTGSDCKKAGGKEIYAEIKDAMRDARLLRDNRVIRTKCTDNCKRAPIVAIMPANRWVHDLSPRDTVAEAMAILSLAQGTTDSATRNPEEPTDA